MYAIENRGIHERGHLGMVVAYAWFALSTKLSAATTVVRHHIEADCTAAIANERHAWLTSVLRDLRDEARG